MLASVIKEWRNPLPARAAADGEPYAVEIEYEVVKRRFMSDGVVLEWRKWKSFRFAEPFITPWKRLKKFKPADKEAWLAKKLQAGWTME